MNDMFRELNENYLGYGDPSGRFWFVGIEGALGYTDVKKIEEELARRKGRLYFEVSEGETQKDKKDFGNKYTSVYKVMTKIILGSSVIDGKWDNFSVSDFENKKLLLKGGDAFQINLFPLGKPKTKVWNDNYNKMFGFKDKKQYYGEVRNNRFGRIRNFWKEWSHPKITICFGIENKEDFTKIFEFEELTDSKSFPDICFSSRSRLILTPFFTPRFGHMSDEKIRDVARIAGTWIREGI